MIIVMTAAAITRKAIRSRPFEMDVYSTSEAAYVSSVPEALNIFTDDVANKQKKNNTAA